MGNEAVHGPSCKPAMPTSAFKDPRNRNACVVTFPFGADADVSVLTQATEILSVVGYAMFSFILMLLVDYVEKGQRDFYLAWITVGFLSSASFNFAHRPSFF